MSVWEFTACAEGYSIANGGKKKGKGMSEDRLRELGIKGV